MKTLRTTVGLLVLGASSSFAALTYNTGDLLLGFRGVGDANSYVVNIGSISNYTAKNGASFTVNTGGNISNDLKQASPVGFGAGWDTRTDLFWGAVGTTFLNSGDSEVIFATKARFDVNTPTTPWKGRSPSAQVDGISLIQALAVRYKQEGTATANSTKGTFQLATAANSWADLTDTNNDFNVGGNIEGSFANGATGSVLDLYQIDPVFNQNATYLGSFTINTNGVVTFTAVPEPGVVALLAAALGLVVIFRRRLLPVA